MWTSSREEKENRGKKREKRREREERERRERSGTERGGEGEKKQKNRGEKRGGQKKDEMRERPRMREREQWTDDYLKHVVNPAPERISAPAHHSLSLFTLFALFSIFHPLFYGFHLRLFLFLAMK